MTFVVEVDQLKQAAEAISPTSAGALSVPRLRLVRASATNIVDRFLAEGCSYALPVDAETSRASTVEIRRAAAAADATEPAPGLDHAMLEALEVPFRETEAALAKALALLQKKHSHAGRVMTTSKAKAGGEDGKTRVVVLGGGGDKGCAVNRNRDLSTKSTPPISVPVRSEGEQLWRRRVEVVLINTLTTAAR